LNLKETLLRIFFVCFFLSSILFILDNILAHSFVHDVMNKEVTDRLFQLAISALNPKQNQQSTRSGLLSWIPLASAVTSSQIYWSSLSIDSSLLSRFPVVSYYFLNAENSFEIEHSVLIELKAELELNPTGKADQVWKKLTQQHHFPSIPLTSLSISRWGIMASEMPVSHPFLPLVWEKFFTIYLSKHEHCLHRVGHRLFESPSQTTFLKQMKRSLCQASEFYATSTTTHPYASQLTTFYHALSLWIDEPRLHDPQLNILSLPQQYNNERLAHLFNTDYHLFDLKWLELVNLKQIYETLTKITDELWPRKQIQDNDNHHHHHQQQHSHLQHPSSRSVMTSSQKLMDLISNVQHSNTHSKSNHHHHSTGESLSSSVSSPQILPHDFAELKALFENELAKITSWLDTHLHRHEKQIDLDQNLMNLLPLLWKNEFQEQSIQASCQNVLNPVHQCTRPAYIIVRYKSKQQCQNSNQRLEILLKEHKQLLTDACRSCDLDICRSLDNLISIYDYLTRQLTIKSFGENHSLKIIELGTQFFYLLLTIYKEQYSEFLQPLAEELHSLYDKFGEIFVKSNSNQPQLILEYIVHSRPNISLLIPYFNPDSLNDFDKFIDIYKKLSKMFSFIDYTPYLLQMFRKFHVQQWFERNSNAFQQHLKFIQTLFEHFRSLVDNYTLAAKRETPPGYDEAPLIEQTSQLFDISIGHMIQILNFSYPSQIGYLFRNLIESIQIMRKKQRLIQQQQNTLVPLEFQQSIERGLLPTKILSEFLEQLRYLEKTSTITLGKPQINDMLQWLQKFVLDQIDTQNEQHLIQLYRSWKPCLNELTRIYSIMLILSLEKFRQYHEVNFEPIFEQILLLYGPFIDQTYSRYSLPEWKSIIDQYGDMLTRLIKQFCQLYEEFFEYISESFHLRQQYFSSIFLYWYRIVKCLISYEQTHPILDIYHRYLPQLPWSHYRLTDERLLVFEDLIQTNNSESIPSASLYEFIIHILSTIDIHSWMIDQDEKLLISITPVYFRLIIHIFHSSQAKYTQVN